LEALWQQTMPMKSCWILEVDIHQFFDTLDHGQLRALLKWCRLHRHDPVAEQHQTLVQKVRGHFVYYGITGNASALQVFRDAVERIWRKWLARRRRRGFLSWASFGRLLERFRLPAVVVVHSVYRR
jgi:hypothetical protein